MKIEILDTTGKKKSDHILKSASFEKPKSISRLMQYLKAFYANQRQGTSSTKRRGEVSGSGIKPWNQKGTGRARVGDKRTPLWRHGGIIHGPKPKSWYVQTNRKLRNDALKSALAWRFSKGDAIVLESLDVKGKTKDAAKIVGVLELKNSHALFVVDQISEEVRKSFGNLKGVELADVSRINAFQTIKADKIVFTKDSLEKLEKRLEGKK